MENGAAPIIMAAKSQMWNSGRFDSISAIVSPCPRPSLARPPARSSTRPRSSPQVIVNSSPLVRIATSPARSADVSRKASARGFAPTAEGSLLVSSVTAPSILRTSRSRLTQPRDSPPPGSYPVSPEIIAPGDRHVSFRTSPVPGAPGGKRPTVVDLRPPVVHAHTMPTRGCAGQTGVRMTEEGTSLGGRAGKASSREARIALASAAGLYVGGGPLTATAVLLPHVSSPAGVVAVGVTAYLTAAGLMLAYTRE